MMYEIKQSFDVKSHEIEFVVHPRAIEKYCRKFRVKFTFELSSGMNSLLVRNLTRQDSIINDLGDVKNDVPFMLRKVFSMRLDGFKDVATKSSAKYLVQESNKQSVFEQIPPLSASVVEYQKSNKNEEEDFSLAWLQVDKTMPQQQVWSELFTSETPSRTIDVIRKYNKHLNEPVLQGEIVVLPTTEPLTQNDKVRLDLLIEEATAASKELSLLTEEQVTTVSRHFELLDYYATEAMQKVEDDGLPSDLYAYASIGVGAISAGVERHLRNISSVLMEINNLYVAQVAMASRTGGINYGTFISERASLFQKLDGSFAALSKRSIKIPIYTQVKRSLKLSTRSIIHNADEIIAKGIVPNLGKRLANVAIGISAARGVGYVGLILGVASGTKNIYDACSVDSNGECGKVATREVGGFMGGIYGGGVGGKAAVAGTLLVLGVVGVTSAPVLAIASIGAFVVGGAVGGIVGSTIGKSVGDMMYVLYEWGQSQIETIQEGFQ